MVTGARAPRDAHAKTARTVDITAAHVWNLGPAPLERLVGAGVVMTRLGQQGPFNSLDQVSRLAEYCACAKRVNSGSRPCLASGVTHAPHRTICLSRHIGRGPGEGQGDERTFEATY